MYGKKYNKKEVWRSRGWIEGVSVVVVVIVIVVMIKKEC